MRLSGPGSKLIPIKKIKAGSFKNLTHNFKNNIRCQWELLREEPSLLNNIRKVQCKRKLSLKHPKKLLQNLCLAEFGILESENLFSVLGRLYFHKTKECVLETYEILKCLLGLNVLVSETYNTFKDGHNQRWPPPRILATFHLESQLKLCESS